MEKISFIWCCDKYLCWAKWNEISCIITQCSTRWETTGWRRWTLARCRRSTRTLPTRSWRRPAWRIAATCSTQPTPWLGWPTASPCTASSPTTRRSTTAPLNQGTTRSRCEIKGVGGIWCWSRGNVQRQLLLAIYLNYYVSSLCSM